MTDKEKTAKIYQALHLKYGNKREFCCLEEIRMGTGFSGTAMRSADYVVISSNNGNDVIVFEVKASKQDFKKDVENLNKQRSAKCISNYFYYITPKGLLDPKEIPDWAGLLEVDLEDKFLYIYKVLSAPRRHNEAPTWGLVAEIIRNLYSTMGIRAEVLFKERSLHQIEHYQKENADLKEYIKKLEKENTEAFFKIQEINKRTERIDNE